MNKELSLSEILAYIDEKYVFTPERFAAIPFDREDDKLAAVLGHNVFHMMKNLGIFGDELQRYQHSRNIDLELIKKRALINFNDSLKLLSELGMSAEQIATESRQYIK